MNAAQQRAGRARWRRLRVPLAVAGAVAVGCVAVALHNPNQPGSWLICPFLATTGFFCVGCGTLRALNALLAGNFGFAMRMNPLLVVSLPLFFGVWVTAVRRAWLNVPRRWTPGPIMLGALPIVIALYWILRNVPGFEFLGPAR